MGLYFLLGGQNLGYQINQIERKLDALLAHFEVEIPNDGLDEARRLAKAGDKIGAIKAYRTVTGCGLREAKDAVENGL